MVADLADELQLEKCHILSISRKRNKPVLDYRLGQDNLAVVSSYPFLGVTVSSDLRWHLHINGVCSKATRTLNFVRRNIYRCPPESKALAYTSLVRPHLEYAAAAWDPHTKRDIAELEKVQRRAARFAKSDYRRTTSVTELLSDLKWEPLSLRRKNTRLAMLFKATHGLSAVPLDGLCRPVRNTRSSKSTTFVRLPSRTDSYKNSFFQGLLLTGIRCPTLLVPGRLLMRSVTPCLLIWPSHRAAANFSLP